MKWYNQNTAAVLDVQHGVLLLQKGEDAMERHDDASSMGSLVIGRMARVIYENSAMEISVPSTGVTVGDVLEKLMNLRLVSSDVVVALLNGRVLDPEEVAYRVLDESETLVVLFP